MRAPPASKRPTIGARAFMAMSWILTILPACVSDSEPPNTVKSLAKTKQVRPFTVPQPVTTPSPGIFCLSMPNSEVRCSTNMSISSNEALSRRRSMRSRAVSLPRLCWASMGSFVLIQIAGVLTGLFVLIALSLAAHQNPEQFGAFGMLVQQFAWVAAALVILSAAGRPQGWSLSGYLGVTWPRARHVVL